MANISASAWSSRLRFWSILFTLFALFWGAGAAWADGAAAALPASNRVEINLGATPWRYLKDSDPQTAMAPAFDDSAWSLVGVPQSPSDQDTFLNMESGGGEGQLTGNINWYRKHFAMDKSYSNRKIYVEFEGAHVGAQVYINGKFIPGNSLVNPNATHVVGFMPFIVDITNQVKFDGSDNVLAVKVARGDAFFQSPSFSGAFRFGQSDAGLFRPVRMHITDRVHVPQNTYSVLQTWGTYVTTLSASDSAAVVKVQTNVLNENTTDQLVTLTTQIVDAGGGVVATAQNTQTVAANVGPGLHPLTFDQDITVNNPTLWYPNNSIYGKPYMYTVVHTVSIGGIVVDAVTTPLGIRTVSWDQNFPIINGHPHYLWGGSGRYDYPALGSAMPEEQKWRDVSLLANAGGSLYRPGHSGEGPEFLAAADAYGVMVVQPSGDGENGFANICNSTVTTNCTTPDNVTLKQELHRDMIVHDRNNPSVLAWEADNGATDTTFAQGLKTISKQWEPILTRAQSDRTPNPANGDILGCSQEGCDILTKSEYPDSPAWGSEYWGMGVARDSYDYELAFAAPFLKDWTGSVRAKSFGIAHWYLADTPGEIEDQVDGVPNTMVRGNAASMMDGNRIPRLLYYMYQAAWTPYEVKPVVKLAHHWNRSGTVTVNAFSNCPKVRLLVNGHQQGADQTPNPQDNDPSANLTQNTTLLPAQAHWSVTWVPGTLTAECVDGTGQIAATDQINTAGVPDHLLLSVDPELVKPDGSAFAITANGTDAAFVTATVVDVNNNRVYTATPIVTFAVAGPGTYRGGADHAVTANQPQGYHAPGDPNLSAEGGMAKVAVKSQFVPGTVTVSASAPGLTAGSITFDVQPISGPAYDGHTLQISAQQANLLQVVAQPISQLVAVGQQAQFTVLMSGAAPLAFQWTKNDAPITGATSFSYTTPATQLADSGASYSVRVTNGPNIVVSNSAVLTVVTASVPVIVVQPQPQSVPSGQSAEFSVQAAGSPTLTYQWYDNGVAIPGATDAVYTTQAMQSSDSGSMFNAIVTNSAGSAPSDGAKLTVGAPIMPTILSQPQSQNVSSGQAVSFSVLANGSAPMHYQWRKGTVAVGSDSPGYVIAAAQNNDAGSYTVTITNAAGTITSNVATLDVSGGSGVNLALNRIAASSSVQNDGLAPGYAFDGDTTSRWSSAPGIDPSWISVDLGSVQTFDQVILVWENAAAAAYQIQVSNDNDKWTTVYTQNAGAGGTETVTFASTAARYVRMLGTARTTDYGYSLFEFGVYNVPQCGGPNERYTLQGALPGQYMSTIAGIPSGPFIPTVQDNVSHLQWQQYVTTFAAQGAQFTQPVAAQYCASVGMRLPTQAEALTIAGANYAQCAMPTPFGTWTTTPVPNDSTNAYFVFSTGASVSAIIDNTPGWALCVSGAATPPPVITAEPTDQSTPQNQSAQFSVTATGTGPLSYQWIKNGNTVATSTNSTYLTQAAVAGDDGAVFSVIVSNAGGGAASTSAKLSVTAPVAGGTGNGNGNGNTGGNTPPPPPVVTDPSANLALGKPATASGTQDGTSISGINDGNLGSRWASAFVDPSWIAMDLGSAQTINRVVLRWEAAYGVAYLIQTSTDNVNWTKVYEQDAGTGGVEVIDFTPTTARYVRMWGTKRASQFGYSLFEFEVYNTAATPQYAISASSSANGSITPGGDTSVYQGGSQVYTMTPASGYAVTGVTVDGASVGLQNSYRFDNVQVKHRINATFGPMSASVNLALGKQTASSDLETTGTPASNAVDGNLGTRWSSSYIDASWMSIDLGTSQSFNRVILRWENAYGVGYQIQSSDDNVNWTTVYTQAAGKGGTEDFTFAPTTARYIRLLGTQRSSQYGYSLYEFEVYNVPVAPAVTTQPADQTVNAGQSAQFSVTATGTGPLSYQWLENGQPLATTSVPTYATAATTSTDNNAAISVVVTNSAGSATSNSAKLTVVSTAPPPNNGGSGGNGSTNLALGMPVTSSGVQDAGYSPSAAVDGNLGSRWASSFVDPSWIAIDLGASRTFDRVVLRWEAAYGVAYQIQVSDDNDKWTTVYSQNKGTGGTEQIQLASSTTARYVRMYGTQRSSQYGYSLYEFEIYNTATTPQFAIAASTGANGSISPSGSAPVYQGGSQTFVLAPAAGYAVTSLTVDGQSIGLQNSYTFNDVQGAHSIAATFGPSAAAANLALNRPVTSSGDENGGTPVTNAVDGDATTRWSSNFDDGAWMVVDMGSVQTFDRVVLQWENAYGKAYQIQSSNDGQKWTTVYTQNAGTGGTEDFSFAPASGRYVRFLGVQRSSQYGYSMFEFQVFNSGGTGSGNGGSGGTSGLPVISKPPVSQSVLVDQSAAFFVTASGTGPFTYQWQKNGVAIPGATHATYNTDAVVAADNNSTAYNVVVTNAAGSTPSSSATIAVGPKPVYTATPNLISVDLQNITKGAFTDDQVYVAVIARDPANGQFAWLKPDGTIVAANVADNDAPNHLTQNGQNYANYFFTLAQAKTMNLPKMSSGRVFVSLGGPMYIKILDDADGNVGFAGPNVLNPTDPNINVNFDWYEFSYNDNGLWINTTQVDQFSFPLLLDVYGANNTFHMQTGINQDRATLFSAYLTETPDIFHANLPTQRIPAPTNGNFSAGQVNGTYFDQYITDMWTYYTTHTLVINMNARQYNGIVQGKLFVFTEVDLHNGAFVGGTYTITGKPTTQDVFNGAGVLALGGDEEKAIEAQVCAAFNRHIMNDVSLWATPSSWYSAAPANFYAKFWHDHGVGGLAYGFPYDDVDNQSTTIQAPQPEHMVFGIGW